MKYSGLILGVWLASLGQLTAQVTVEVTLDQDQFLPGESVPAAVRITNRSGQTLQLGKDDYWLTFGVESKDGYVVLKKGRVPVEGEFTLQSSQRAIKRVDLAPYFDLTMPGRYSIIATVTIRAWNQNITSQPRTFDVIEGAKLWEQKFGVPQPPGATNRLPEVRTYLLQEANHLRQGLRLYLRLVDASGRINKVVPIGPMLSFGQPDAQVDRLSNLHVLYQNGPRSFNYLVFDPDANLLVRRSYDYTTRPRLQADGDGGITVSGGTRRVTLDDLPPPKVADSKATNATTPAP
jgi:hypothetical protein